MIGLGNIIQNIEDRKLTVQECLIKHFKSNIAKRNGKWCKVSPTGEIIEELDLKDKDIDTIVKSIRQKEDITKKVSKLKKEGIPYNINGVTYLIPIKNEDAIGLMQVKNAFELGITSTIMNFSNGVKLPINNKTELQKLLSWFSEKRNLVFTDPDNLLKDDNKNIVKTKTKIKTK